MVIFKIGLSAVYSSSSDNRLISYEDPYGMYPNVKCQITVRLYLTSKREPCLPEGSSCLVC